jgi:hypothetical protein
MSRTFLPIVSIFASATLLGACSAAPDSASSPVGSLAEGIDAPRKCALASADGRLRHVVYVQFDNLHFSRDNQGIPSDLEQMPHLLSFLTGEGTLLTRHHTPLISHTANDIVTALTGLYPDRHGVAVANSYRTFTPSGVSVSAPSFTYWTDPVGPSDTAYNMVGRDGKNAPAPWVAYTRAGCDFGAVSVANTVLENVAGDVTTVFGAGSPQAAEATSDPNKATADYVGIAIHCAKGSRVCGEAGRPDVLPDEAGGYTGFPALFGHAAVAPRISSAPLVDLDGAPIADESGRPGFPGFDGMSATRSLAYVATMLEAGVPVVHAYISDAHDNHDGDGAYGPGAAGYVAALAAYDAAFAKFFARLSADGIDRSNTLFVFTADEGDHFVGGAPSPAGCDGVSTPCTYAQIGEINANLTGLLAQQGITTKFSIAQSLGIYVNGNPAPNDAATRTLERGIGALQATNPITSQPEPVSRYVADRAEMGLLHMMTGDPLRAPTFTMFVNPNFYVYAGAPTCTAAAPCVLEEAGYAWNHGMVSTDVNVTWLGMVGPGVRHLGVDDAVWSDHTDVRPTMLALAGLADDYVHQGRPLFEAMRESAIPASLDARDDVVQSLLRVYKQINAPVGPFSLATLRIADDAAKSGDASNDDRFTRTEALLASLGARRDELAQRMETAIDGATFGGHPIDRHAARDMIADGELLLLEAELLSASL